MTDREHLIRERAFSLWETEGNPDGRHEDHWAQAEREIDGGNTGSLATDTPRPPEMDLEAIPLPDQVGSSEGQDMPPARTGQSANKKNPVEGAGLDNPIHHTVRQPIEPRQNKRFILVTDIFEYHYILG